MLSGLKQHIFIISWFWRGDVYVQVSSRLCSSGGLRESPACPAPRRLPPFLGFWLHSPSAKPAAERLQVFLSPLPCRPASAITSPSSLLEGPLGYLGPTQRVQDNLPISTRAKSLLSHHLTYLQVSGIRPGTSLGPIVLPPSAFVLGIALKIHLASASPRPNFFSVLTGPPNTEI